MPVASCAFPLCLFTNLLIIVRFDISLIGPSLCFLFRFPLTIQFKREEKDEYYVIEKLILGTHTSDGQYNHLIIAEVQLPTENAGIGDIEHCEGNESRKISSNQSTMSLQLLMPIFYLRV